MLEKVQRFNDGILDLYKIKNQKEITMAISNLRFEYRTVGSERFYKAAEQQKRIDNIVRIPMIKNVEANDIILIGEEQFTILQAQKILDTKPKCWQLSVEKRTKRNELIKCSQ